MTLSDHEVMYRIEAMEERGEDASEYRQILKARFNTGDMGLIRAALKEGCKLWPEDRAAYFEDFRAQNSVA